MNSLELLFALLAVASFAAFAIGAEKSAQDDIVQFRQIFADKEDATRCAALANQYYANAGGLLKGQMACTFEDGFARSGSAKSGQIPAALYAGGMLIEVEGHYGN